MKNLPHASLPNPLCNLAAVVATAAVIGLALMLSVVLVAVIVVAGTLGWAYLWWKTRGLRRLMRNYPPGSVAMEQETAANNPIKGEVIEGEVIRVDIREEK